ncbi:MAG: hypothetical protein JNL80_14690 [Phycisphaerae bacterium]|nr:hypothetical protein [Phycisphaerae bacterium]
MTWNGPHRHALTVVASTDAFLRDFSPYVPSINGDGVVAFQATDAHGHSSVHCAIGQQVTAIAPGAGLAGIAVRSHPDINRSGQTSFYAEGDGRPGVFLVEKGDLRRIHDGHGPLGPTMNESGSVAFRATGPSGGEAIFVSTSHGVRLIAEAGERFAAFHGLPLMEASGSVAFRADRTDGIHGIYRGDGSSTQAVIECGSSWRSIGPFPSCDDAGRIGFCAERCDGTVVACIEEAGEITEVVSSANGFESLRTVLLGADGPVAVVGTPIGGTLGIFTGPNLNAGGLLSRGAGLLGASVVEFALNPVSVNGRGQLAIRVRFADGRQCILRADPVV